jgi:uncharacterized SAM-binding protein YcdF (DUF218 family)
MIIPTGGWGAHFNTTAKPHGLYVRDFLAGCGIPDSAFTECIESSNTIEDARFSRPVVDRYGFRRLIVVTSDFHVARARYFFTREFADTNLEFSGSLTHLPEEQLEERIAHERNALARLAKNSGATNAD